MTTVSLSLIFTPNYRHNDKDVFEIFTDNKKSNTILLTLFIPDITKTDNEFFVQSIIMML